MRRSISIVLLAAGATLPAGCTTISTSPSPGTAPAPTVAVPGATGASRSIAGPVVDMEWGPVQVTIIVTGRRITDVRASAPTERPRSAFINNQAIPWLRQETLQAQSANIDLISGATMISEAFDQSLQAALTQAHI